MIDDGIRIVPQAARASVVQSMNVGRIELA
jgi:hypothetical protein